MGWPQRQRSSSDELSRGSPAWPDGMGGGDAGFRDADDELLGLGFLESSSSNASSSMPSA